METLKLSLIFLLVFLGVNCSAQRPQNGIYRSKHGFLYVSNDTIIMDLSTHYFYYLGTYTLNEDKFVLGKNRLIGKNATIKTESCSPDSIEIKLICKYEMIFEEADKYPRQSMYCVFYSEETKSIESKEDGIIYIGVDENKNKFDIDSFFVSDRVQYSFADRFKIALEYGKRYVICQKINGQPMFLDNNPLTMCFKAKKNGKKNIKCLGPCYGYDTFEFVGECDSYIEEFKKQFPGLLE